MVESHFSTEWMVNVDSNSIPPPLRKRRRFKPLWMHETGRPDVLRLEEAEQPEPGEGEVLIGVRAASVNPIDWRYRRGTSTESCRRCSATTCPGRSKLPAARASPRETRCSAWPRVAATRSSRPPPPPIAKKPSGVSHEQAAAIPVAGLTAWQALFDRGGLERGQTVLVAGAAGGVGHFAVQFAKQAGARTIGTGSSRNRDFVLGLGAEEYVDYTQQDVAAAASGVDVAFDTVGGETTLSLLPAVREEASSSRSPGLHPSRQRRSVACSAELLVMTPTSQQLRRSSSWSRPVTCT